MGCGASAPPPPNRSTKIDAESGLPQPEVDLIRNAVREVAQVHADPGWWRSVGVDDLRIDAPAAIMFKV